MRIPSQGNWENITLKKGEYVNVYVRYGGVHLIKGQIEYCIDIANVNCTPKGKGVFSKYLLSMEKLAKEKKMILFIENVLSERFQKFFEKRGYTEALATTQTTVKSYWRKFHE